MKPMATKSHRRRPRKLTARLPLQRIQALLKNLPGWRMVNNHTAIRKQWCMKNFIAAVNLIRKVAILAESIDHHPDLQLKQYRKLSIELSTHSAGGLTGKDFTLASRIERLPKQLKTPHR